VAAALAGLLFVWGPSPAPAQQRGGIVNWFNYGDPGRLNVFNVAALGQQQAVAGVFSGLMQFSPDEPSKIIPDLAESYAETDNGRTYTFHLRHGVTWHDGKPFTSADVTATYDYMLDPANKGKRCTALMKPVVKSYEAPDDYTVVFHLKFAAPTYLPSVASAWCRIAAKHILAEYKGNLDDPKAQIGTGPFMLKRYDRGSLIEWVRNPHYYNPKLPYVDGVKQFILKGTDRQVAAAKAGQIDLWDTWPPMSHTRAMEIKAAAHDKAYVYEAPINSTWEVHLNWKKSPFNIKDIRRAVQLGLDRKQLFDKGEEGSGTPCAILDPGLYGDYAIPMKDLMKIPGCREDKKAEDIATAKKLVAKHFPNGVDFEIVTRSVGTYVDRVQLVADQLRKIGLRGHIKTYESAAGYAAYAKGDFTMIGTQDSGVYLSDPEGIFTLLFTKGAAHNWENWDDPTVAKWVDEALRERNHEKRVKLYRRIQYYLLEKDNTSPVIGWVAGWFYTAHRLKNYHHANTIYDNNTFQSVWLEQ